MTEGNSEDFLELYQEMPDIFEDFVEITSETLGSIETQLRQFKSDQSNFELVDGMMRDLHSIKGSAANLQIEDIKELAHLMESVLTKVRDARFQLAPGHFGSLFEAYDLLVDLNKDVREALTQGGKRSGDLPCQKVAARIQKIVEEGISSTESTSFKNEKDEVHENPFAQMSVLVVDDNVINRKVLCGILKKWDMEIEQAENGLVALKKAQANVPDLILLDLMMPEMDGFEFLAAAQEQPSLAGVPIIVCSAMDANEEIERARKLGAASYLVKPIRSEALREKIKIILKIQTKDAKSQGNSNPRCSPIVFVLDDHLEMVAIVKKLVESEGYLCEMSTNSKAALDLMKTVQPDLVISDYMMPGLDGLEFIEKLPTVYKKIPVIMITAHPGEHLFEEAKSKGAVACFTKPLDFEKLMKEVKSALSQ